MTHPSTIRRRARAAGEPPKAPGRKRGPEETRRVSLTVWVLPAVKAHLEALAEARGVSVGAVVEDLAAEIDRPE